MRTLRLALIASLFANLFLLGMLVGGAVWIGRGRGVIAAGALRVAGSELPAPERHAFRAALREARRSAHPAVAASRAAKARTAALLRAPVLDEPAVLAALADARAADLAVRAAVETRAVRFAAGLPAAERARLAAAMEQRARPARGRR